MFRCGFRWPAAWLMLNGISSPFCPVEEARPTKFIESGLVDRGGLLRVSTEVTVALDWECEHDVDDMVVCPNRL